MGVNRMQMNIMGVMYEVVLHDEATDIMIQNKATAYCNTDRKQIMLARLFSDGEFYDDGEGTGREKSLDTLMRDLCHELAHVYLYEMGCEEWSDEDWAERISVILTRQCEYLEDKLRLLVEA